MRVDAKRVIGQGTSPSKDGEALARYVIEHNVPLGAKTVFDVSDVAPEVLVSSFVNAFLIALEDAGLELGKPCFRWEARFDSESKRLDLMVEHYMSIRQGPNNAELGAAG